MEPISELTPETTEPVAVIVAAPVEVSQSPAPLTDGELFLKIMDQLDRLSAELESVRDAQAVTQGYVRRIGECPGLKLF